MDQLFNDSSIDLQLPKKSINQSINQSSNQEQEQGEEQGEEQTEKKTTHLFIDTNTDCSFVNIKYNTCTAMEEFKWHTLVNR